MSMPSLDRITTRFEHERRQQNVVTIHIDESIRKQFHRQQIVQSEIEKNRRGDKSAKNPKKPLIDEST